MHYPKHTRISKFVAAAATATIAAAMIAVGAPAASAATTVNISGGFSGFTPKTFSVTVGVPTTITYKNPDATDHDVAIADLGFKTALVKSGSASAVLTATAAQVGTHKFICDVPGHDSAMNGTMTVVAAGASTGPAPAAPKPAAGGTAPAPAQVGTVPSGGVQTGGGSTAGFNHPGLVTLGGGLLLAAFMSAMLGWRVARRN